MRIGWIGLGKLGAPIASEVGKTHEVLGYDIAPRRPERVQMQDSLAPLLGCDLVFIAVPTPHGPQYEGITRIPETRSDFDYGHLRAAVSNLADAGKERPPLVVISTTLPGTIEREVLPLWSGPVIFNPFFIAMGEEVADFLDPEFVLIGCRPGETVWRKDHPVFQFYESLGLAHLIQDVGYREAELAKMSYNTFIGLKIAFANTVGELCHRLDIDADAVMDVLKSGHKRIISEAYLSPGMGDGGPCHPRDNIALSWLARETGMSFDLFGAVMEQRERHAEWLADLIEGTSMRVPLDDPEGLEQYVPVTVLGKSYKPNTSLQTGSPALLLAELLRRRGIEFDHEDDPEIGRARA